MEKWEKILINHNEANYEVSNEGRIRNARKLNWKTQGILSPKYNKQNGYCQVSITLNKKKYYRYVHRLVATAFISNPNNLPHVNHKDGNKTNNKANNLEWVTPKMNMKHAFYNMLVEGTQKPVSIYALNGSFVGSYPSISEAIRCLLPEKNYSTLGINAVILFDINRQMYGYQWRLQGSDVPVYNIQNTFHGHKGVVQLTLDNKYVKEFDKITDACRELGVLDNGEISRVCKGKQKTSHGYKWMYKKDYYVPQSIVN